MIDVSHVEGAVRLFLSAGQCQRNGFIATQQDELDLLKWERWEASFADRKIEIILAEHAWERLTFEESKVAGSSCHDFFEPGGFVRCEVLDGYFPDPRD